MDQKTHDKGWKSQSGAGRGLCRQRPEERRRLQQPFQELLNEYCWGAVWGREELPRKTRSMLNIAMISILNRRTNCGAHQGRADQRRHRDEIREILMQVAIYAGMPARRQFPDRARSVRGNRQG